MLVRGELAETSRWWRSRWGPPPPKDSHSRSPQDEQDSPEKVLLLQRALKAEEQTLLLREALHRIRSEINAALARPGVGEPENQKPVSEGASAADTISRLLRERDLLLLRLDQFAVRAREAEGRVTDLRRQLDALRSAINEALKI
jgi:hypothetical protein